MKSTWEGIWAPICIDFGSIWEASWRPKPQPRGPRNWPKITSNIPSYFERLLDALLSKIGPHDYPNLTKRERKAYISRCICLSFFLSVSLSLSGRPWAQKALWDVSREPPGPLLGWSWPSRWHHFGSQNGIQIEFLRGLSGPWAPTAFWEASWATPGALLGSSYPPRWPQIGH